MLKLYLTFFKIGILAFGGGYVILPLIEEYIVKQNKWIDSIVLLDVISISQITPGPIAINSATFIGMKLFFIIGAIITTLGVITPQIIISTIFFKFIGFKNKYIKNILITIKSATISLIFISIINIMKRVIEINNGINLRMLICFSLSLFLSFFKIRVIYIILISAIISILI